MLVSDAAFKFVLFAGVVILLLLAVLGSSSCAQRRLEEKELFSAYVASSGDTVAVTENLKSSATDLLYSALSGSQTVAGAAAFSPTDVFVVKSPQEIIKPGDPKFAQKFNDIVTVVPAQTYLPYESEHCSSVSLLMNRTDNASTIPTVRVFDSIYRVCATCFRVKATGGSKLVITASPSASTIFLLNPFACTQSSASSVLNKVTSSSIDLTTGDVTLNFNAGATTSPLQNLDVYYLDYVEPITDYHQNQTTPPSYISTFSTNFDVNAGKLALSTWGAQFGQYVQKLGIITATISDKMIPGMLNLASFMKATGKLGTSTVDAKESMDYEAALKSKTACLVPDAENHLLYSDGSSCGTCGVTAYTNVCFDNWSPVTPSLLQPGDDKNQSCKDCPCPK